MYNFYNTKSVNVKDSFDNLRAAIEQHDEVMTLLLLRDNPQIINLKSEEGKTIPMLAAAAGCSKDVFQTILEDSAEILDEQTENGDTVESILRKNKRGELLNLLHSFKGMQVGSRLARCGA